MVWPFKTRTFQTIQQKASKTGRAIYLQTLGRPIWTPRQYDTLARESYNMNPVAHRCVRLLAEAAAQMPCLSKTVTTPWMSTRSWI